MRKTSSLPGSTTTESADFPYGRIVDNATPVIEATYSDFIQSLWHIVQLAGVIPNGLPDSTTNGFQLAQALQKMFEPVGTLRVQLTGAYDVPDGWVGCNGALVSEYLYPDLFAKLGYSFGGSAHNFNLPNIVPTVGVGGQSYIIKAKYV